MCWKGAVRNNVALVAAASWFNRYAIQRTCVEEQHGWVRVTVAGARN